MWCLSHFSLFWGGVSPAVLELWPSSNYTWHKWWLLFRGRGVLSLALYELGASSFARASTFVALRGVRGGDGGNRHYTNRLLDTTATLMIETDIV